MTRATCHPTLLLSVFLFFVFSFTLADEPGRPAPDPAGPDSAPPAATPRQESAAAATPAKRPHLVFVMLDDVGWADFSYHQQPESGQKPLPHTPFIDQLSARGVRLETFYTAHTCTPSRAALMTGLYPSRAGMTLAMFHGSIAGLPTERPTLPELLRDRAGYQTHMVGKWHLGYASATQSPVGRGFSTWTGSFMWGLDPFSKTVYKEPWVPLAMDWTRAKADGQGISMEHFLDGNHTTYAITREAQRILRAHVEKPGKEGVEPLFLYVSYTAAHSPLLPAAPEHEQVCQHSPHLWRRNYCGLVVGLDEALQNLTNTIQDTLGEDVVLVVSSDNGGSTWFGGLNQPLRGGKTTPFEGGVRVPAFAVDLSAQGQWLGRQARPYAQLLHMADWMPTMLSWAGLPAEQIAALDLDGVDASAGLREDRPVREEMLLDLQVRGEGHANDAYTYRAGKWKLIEGKVADGEHYLEPSEDYFATEARRHTLTTKLLQLWIRAVEAVFGEEACELIRVVATHEWFKGFEQNGTWLFDVEADPQERRNLAAQEPQVVAALRAKALLQRQARRVPEPWWLTVDMDGPWQDTFVGPGHPSVKATQEECDRAGVPRCRWLHPFVLSEQHRLLQPVLSGYDLEARTRKKAVWRLAALLLVPLLLVWRLCCSRR